MSTQTELVKEPRKVQREVPVKLTETELAQVAREIGRLDQERKAMEAQAKVANDQWKDRIRGVDARIADLATKAHEGQEARMVDCLEVFDYRLGEVRVHRADTEERLEVRPMTADERQPSLPAPGMEAKAKKAKKAEEPANANDAGATSSADPDAPPGDGK